MTKKLLTAVLAIVACAALWGAVCPRNASIGKVPAVDQTTSTAAASQEGHTEAIPLSAAEKEYAPAKETSLPLPTDAPVPVPTLTEPQPPAVPAKETAALEVKPAQAPQPVQSPQPEQPQPSADPAPGERSAAGGKAQVWVPGFGWVEDGGGNIGVYAEDMYENGNKIGSMG
jgi:outer membrane biosynthesis protein TonB